MQFARSKELGSVQILPLKLKKLVFKIKGTLSVIAF